MAPDPVSNQASEEPALIARAQGGELAAFDQLVRQHQSQVFAVALRMLGDADDAQEVAQDAFVRAFRSIGTFRREAKLSTWLIAITMNLCRNRRRWWARRKRVIAGSLDAEVAPGEGSIGDRIADPSPTPAEIAQHREQGRQVLAALQGMTEDARAVMVLRDVQGYSYEEIARMLRCQVGTVKSRLNRARWQLRALLDGALR